MKEYSAYDMNRKMKYMMQMRPVLKKNGLFSDGTADYRIPAEPEAGQTVIIRFRATVNNVDIIWLHSGAQRFAMHKTETEDEFDYFSVMVPLGTERFCYYFEVCTGLIHCFYDRCGVATEHRPQYEFCIQPGFHTPDWAKGAVMYQILVDRFYNGDPANDVEDNEYYYIRHGSRRMKDWNEVPSGFSVAEFYGGDLEGVRKKLDYLQDLGIEAIYFNPLFVSPSNHKYDSQDYDHVDPHCGKIVKDGGRLLEDWETDNTHADRYILRTTDSENLEASDRLLIQVIEEAHKRGIRVILDGVFNHCGSFNKWLDRERIYENKPGYEKGAYISEDSPYHDYFSFHDNNRFPYNPTYDGWWGHDTLPKLNYEGSRQLEDYILQVARKWVSAPFHADGWRLDVAADLGHSPEYNHRFWAKFRDTVKEANPHALIVAEHYGDPSSWLQGDQWDTVMNYDAFMEPVSWFLTGMEKHSDDYRQDLLGNADSFVGAMAYHGANMAMPSWLTAMNELSNHDHSRFLTRTNHIAGRVEQLGYKAAEEGINEAIIEKLGSYAADVAIPGFPVFSGTGSAFVNRISLGMCSSSENKDGIWNFYQYLLSDEAQESRGEFQLNTFPVKKSIWERDCKYFMQPENTDIYWIGSSLNEQSYEVLVPPLTEAMVDDFNQLIEQITCVYEVDPQLMQILLEETEKYCQNQVELELAAKSIIDRIMIYQSESGM